MAEHQNVINALIRERDGWRDEATKLQHSLKLAQADLDLRRAHQEPDVWFFQGDGEDHIESMGNRMVVVIHASDLRRLLEAERAGNEGAALRALRYYRDHCSGNEPSISVFQRMVDEALSSATEAPTSPVPSLPDTHVAVPASLLQKLTSWRLCMSYDASYFGEPAGLLKHCVAELDRLLTAKPAAPAPAASPVPADLKAAVSKIEDDVARGSMTAPMVFTKMRYLLALAAAPSAPTMLNGLTESAASVSAPAQQATKRPSQQWYAKKIAETLDDDFVIGPATAPSVEAKTLEQMAQEAALEQDPELSAPAQSATEQQAEAGRLPSGEYVCKACGFWRHFSAAAGTCNWCHWKHPALPVGALPASAPSVDLASFCDAVFKAAINCGHSISDKRITLNFDKGSPGHNALNQLHRRLYEAICAALKEHSNG